MKRPNKSVKTDTHRQRAARRAGNREPRGALPERAGHLQRWDARAPMAKYCVFCGKPPSEKNKEHVLPRWLISLTGDPKRKVRLGFRLGTDNPVKQREFAFDQFTFPACEACNSEHSDLEADAKDLVERTLAADPLSAIEISRLLDWLDKVRVGLWLGFHMLNKDFFGVEPNFHIKRRIGQFDRILLVQRSMTALKRLNFSGADTPAFSYQPSAFTLTINELYLTNISSAYLLSRRLGFPYPDRVYLLPDRHELFCNLQPGLNRVLRPVVQRTWPREARVIFQPMFGQALNVAPTPAYDTPYVRQHSMDFDHGVGSVFVEDGHSAVRVLERDERYSLHPAREQDDRKLFIRSVIDTCLLQNWLIDQPLSLDRLLPKQRRFVRGRQRLAKRFNEMLNEHHRGLL